MHMNSTIRIKELMKKDIITIREEENLDQLMLKFLRYNFHTLPVVGKGNKLLGVVNYEDLTKIFIPNAHSIQREHGLAHICRTVEEAFLEAGIPSDFETNFCGTLSDIMKTDIVTIEENMTLIEARILMRTQNVTKMHVTNKGILVGFVTLFDIAIAFLKLINIAK